MGLVIHFVRFVQLAAAREDADHICVAAAVGHASNNLLCVQEGIEVGLLVVLVVDQGLGTVLEDAMASKEAYHQVILVRSIVSAIGNPEIDLQQRRLCLFLRLFFLACKPKFV